MVEVFKTNVCLQEEANTLLKSIHQEFPAYQANFDLEDCDKILRVKCQQKVEPAPLIGLLRSSGFEAEVLPG